jgi:hypothetical protein
MLLLYNGKRYGGQTASEIVEQIRRDSEGYGREDGSIKPFLAWSLGRLADRIPQRELDVSEDLPDEAVAFNYLCILDAYDGGLFLD